MAEKIRLQKYFSDCGVMSRRGAEEEIAKGLVKVNGIPASLGTQIDPDTDTVEYKGSKITHRHAEKTYIMLNKPRGYVCTLSDEKGRKTVISLLDGLSCRVVPVGRLDMDSEGLLFLTDDGELVNRLTHPKHDIPKIYNVTVRGLPSKEKIKALGEPMEIDGYKIMPVKTRPISTEDGNTVLEMTLFEGRNRQIRKMCAAVGLTVLRLRRVAVGDIKLSELPVGKWRYLLPKETEYLKNGK